MKVIPRTWMIRNRYFLVIDLILIVLSAVLSFAIRLDIPLLWTYVEVCAVFALLTVLVKPGVYYLFGMYRRFWRYASMEEVILIIVTVTLASALLSVVVLGIFLPLRWFTQFPRSVLIIDYLLSLFCVGGVRFSVRFLGERDVLGTLGLQRKARVERKRVLVVGAGDAGAMIVREMQANPRLGMIPVGYIDDNWAKVGMQIREVPVLGTRERIGRLVNELNIDEVIIAMPTAPGQVIREVKQTCDSVPVPFKTIPGMYELLDGTVSVRQIRDVQIEDLLRREPVARGAQDAVYLRDKIVLVTGAGGSIGSELCRQVASQRPKRLILLGHGEYSIYAIYQELSRLYRWLELVPIIADVRDRFRVDHVAAQYAPQVIFHAAAHKHVPLMEANPHEAITNNLLGTLNVLLAAERHDVERFVLISTDKAVNPHNVMGATKRIAELLVQDAAQRSARKFVAVRFGNVLGSRGSVVPLFQKQIAAGGPVTVTDPEMTRYFMTIPEAVHLVIRAGALGLGGEIFVLDMGEPVKILDLAHDLITLSGFQPGRDISIVFTGLRPGEKLEERLFLEGESYETTPLEKVFVVTSSVPCARPDELRRSVRRLVRMAYNLRPPDDLWAQIKQVVPECEVGLPPASPLRAGSAGTAPAAAHSPYSAAA